MLVICTTCHLKCCWQQILENDSFSFGFMNKVIVLSRWGSPGGSDSKAPTCNAGDPGLILGSGSSPEEGSGDPLQHSCLKNSMDRGAWRVTVHGITKSRTWLTDNDMWSIMMIRQNYWADSQIPVKRKQKPSFLVIYFRDQAIQYNFSKPLNLCLLHIWL